eukprot:1859964-Rhodomonas_salina.2
MRSAITPWRHQRKYDARRSGARGIPAARSASRGCPARTASGMPITCQFTHRALSFHVLAPHSS